MMIGYTFRRYFYLILIAPIELFTRKNCKLCFILNVLMRKRNSFFLQNKKKQIFWQVLIINFKQNSISRLKNPKKDT